MQSGSDLDPDKRQMQEAHAHPCRTLTGEFPCERNTEAEKAAIKAGTIPEDWKDKPAKLR